MDTATDGIAGIVGLVGVVIGSSAEEPSTLLKWGDTAEPVIEEYQVGPLPHPTTYSKIIHTKWRTPIPYSLRSPTAEGDIVPWKEFICRELAKAKHVLTQVTGYSYSSNCKDRCLTYMVVLPGHLTTSVRSMWISVYRRVKGFPLQPIGFQFRVNLPTTNSCNWNVDFVWFQNQNFTNMEDFNSSFSKPDIESIYIKSFVNSSFSEKEETLPPQQHGPRSYMPDGRRFSVNGRKVDWFGWSFNFNIRTTTGIQLHDIRFNNDRIVYELSLQEIVSLYSGAPPATASSVSMESRNFLGKLSQELYPGIDCPEDASYFDFVHYVHFRPTRYRNAACLFERNQGVLQNRQRGKDGYLSRSAETLLVHTLVLRTVIVTDWYDYILDFVFHPNAVLETVLSISGSIQPEFYTKPAINNILFGFELFQDSTANIHNHLINFKVDLDINGHENRIATLDSAKNSPRVRLGENETSQDMHYYTRQVWYTELSTKQKRASAASNYQYLFYHVNHTNTLGTQRAYRLVPLATSKFMLPASFAKSMTWALYQVVVTKRKDDEDTSSTIYNAMDMLNPVLSFESYINDAESIIDEDLTAWVTIGSMHIPHSEDIPIVETPGSQLSFILQPFNFLDPDPLPAPSIQPAEKTRQEMGNSPRSQKARDYECRPVLVKSSSTGSRLRQRSVFWHLCWSFCIAPAVSVWMSLHVQHQLKWF